MTPLLRPVQPAEAGALYELLLQLGESDGVKEIRTTLASLQTHLFGDTPAAHPHWVMAGDDVAGFSIHSWKWGPFTGTRDLYVQALYIRPRFRRQGLAGRAMAALARVALAAGGTRMEWFTVRDKAMARGFYDALGAQDASHMAIRRLQGEALARLAGSR